MKKIKIFIGSSIEDLAYERRDIVSFIAELNNQYIDREIYIEPYICEEKPSELRSEGSQAKHDKYITDDADAMIFMFFQKAGQYTMRELQLAREVVLNKANNPSVFIFFKTFDDNISDSEDIKNAIDKISGEYAHYYKKFSETDTIKLELLQYLSSVLTKDNKLSIINGKVFIGSIEVNDLVLSNVFAYQNNKELNNLRLEIAECENKMQLYLSNSNWSDFERLVEIHRDKQKKYYELETDILHMLQQLFNATREKIQNPIRIKALSLLEEGNFSEAKKLLPLEAIESRTKALIAKKCIQDAFIKHEAHEVLEDAKTRIYSLRFDVNNDNVNNDLLMTYESAVEVSIIDGDIQFLIEYVDLLIENNQKEKAYEIAKLIESNIKQFTDLDLYSKYDLYNQLAELSDVDEEEKRYYKKAIDSLIEYIGSLDERETEKYVNNCLRLSELVDTKTSLPYLIRAIDSIESNSSIFTQENEKRWVVELYLFTAYAYEELNDLEKYELYLCKAKEHFSHLLIDFDEMKNILHTKNDNECIHDDVLKNYLWIIKVYQRLYQLKKDVYDFEFMTQLFILAGLCLSFDHIKMFAKYIVEALMIVDQNPKEYNDLKELYLKEYRQYFKE